MPGGHKEDRRRAKPVPSAVRRLARVSTRSASKIAISITSRAIAGLPREDHRQPAFFNTRHRMADPEALYGANHRRLFRYFCRAVGRADTARDLTQEVFLRVSRTAIPAAAEGDLRGWLFRIARNLVLDHHRGLRRHPQPVPMAVEPMRAASQDVSAAVNQALASLPAVNRDVFLMREVAGLGYDEIAAACELTPDAVRSRLHRTRLLLREQLAAPIATCRTLAIRRVKAEITDD